MLCKFQHLTIRGNVQATRPVATVKPNATIRPTPVVVDATDKELEREVNLLRNESVTGYFIRPPSDLCK